MCGPRRRGGSKGDPESSGTRRIKLPLHNLKGASVMLLEVRIKGYADLDSGELPEFDEVEGRYRHITPGCVERAINRAKRLTADKGEIYYEADTVKQAIADGINKTPLTHHQAIIMMQRRGYSSCRFNVILDTQPVQRA